MLNRFREIWKIPILEKFLYQITKDSLANSWIYRLAPNHYQFRKNSTRFAKRKGIMYKFDISDMVDWFLYFGFKEEGRVLMEKLINPGDTVYDIGANIGDVTLKAALKTGKAGYIYSFEPDSRTFKKLEKNLSLNNFDNIELFNIGLGEQEGKLKLFNVDPRNKGKNRILNDNNNKGAFELIKIHRLDTFFEKNKLKKPDFIKIDVEGFEHKVLIGMGKILEFHKPHLFIEISDSSLRENGTSPEQIFNLLWDIGYKIEEANTSKVIGPNDNYKNCHLDILCFPI